MRKLRMVHLYLGSLFSPMLIFFAVSGIWQTVDPHYDKDSKVLAMLSTIHQSHGLKAAHADLSGPVMRWFVVAMASGLVVTSILGIIMTLKMGRSRNATLACLAFGVLFPVVLALISYFG